MSLDAAAAAGALSVELARRGADVVANRRCGSIIDFRARKPCRPISVAASIAYAPATCWQRISAPRPVVAMDSLIHYEPDTAIERASGPLPPARAAAKIVFTFAPCRPALA